MASFVRSYGVDKVKSEEKFHWMALQWCDDNDYDCSGLSSELNEVDSYFRRYYEEWD